MKCGSTKECLKSCTPIKKSWKEQRLDYIKSIQNEKMLVFWPHSYKITKTVTGRKMGRSEEEGKTRKWRRITADVPRAAVTRRWPVKISKSMFVTNDNVTIITLVSIDRTLCVSAKSLDTTVQHTGGSVNESRFQFLIKGTLIYCQGPAYFAGLVNTLLFYSAMVLLNVPSMHMYLRMVIVYIGDNSVHCRCMWKLSK